MARAFALGVTRLAFTVCRSPGDHHLLSSSSFTFRRRGDLLHVLVANAEQVEAGTAEQRQRMQPVLLGGEGDFL